MFSTSRSTLTPLASNKHAQDLLVYVHFSSPIILLIFFLLAFTAHSIATASTDTTVKGPGDQTGPGGKPLPSSKKAPRKQDVLDFSPARKLLFNWLSVGTIATFVGSAVAVISHTLVNRKDNWWCGQSTAVCHSSLVVRHREADTPNRSISSPPSSHTPYFSSP